MFIYNHSGVKTTRGHGPETPFFRVSVPLEQMSPRNFRGQNIENEKIFGSIFGKRAQLAIDHIMLALFWSYVPNMK